MSFVELQRRDYTIASKGLNARVTTVMAIDQGWGCPTSKTQIIFVLLFSRREATFLRWEGQHWSFPD